MKDCPNCYGTGDSSAGMTPNKYQTRRPYQKCSFCNGTGKSNKCKKCGGTGKVRRTKTTHESTGIAGFFTGTTHKAVTRTIKSTCPSCNGSGKAN